MSADSLEHRIALLEPAIGAHHVTFSWEVTPPTELYQRSYFSLSFPPALDLGRVPQALWWRIAMICLYSHWALLRPCRVELPVSLGAAEREFWLRLIGNTIAQLEAYGSPPRPGRGVELIDVGPPLPPVALGGDSARAAVSFSGGKDSLVLSALLAELTERPLLVTTTSPVPWARDHVGAARKRARTEIVKRLPVDLIEVRSDYRTCWRLDFAWRDGSRLGVHELSDLPLFQSATVAAAAASGIGRTFMASEADLQYNACRDGVGVLHPEFMSCAVTQGSLDALLARFGLRQASLTYPLHMPQVQALLLGRYRALADLQFSCWQAPEGEQACSVCEQCFLIALVTLAEGISPRAVGIDAVRTLCSFGDWSLDTPSGHGGPPLHELRRGRHHVVRALQQLPTAGVASILANDEHGRDDPRLGEAIAVWSRLRAEALALIVPPPPGYIEGFLDLVPADLRERLRAIFDQYFLPAPKQEFEETVARTQALTAWITEPFVQRGHVSRARDRAGFSAPARASSAR